MDKNILADLKYRELVYQLTDENELEKRLAKPIVLYCGFDPSADSLHLGNLQQILILKRFQQAGHQPMAIAGGGTGLIGDPSGKKEERQLNAKKVIDQNLKKITYQLKRLLPGVKVVNNYTWLGKMKIIEYLRDIGKHFPVNLMLAKETVKARLEVGISFTEFNYMVLQAVDFLELFRRYHCELQVGGSDQWGNITAGAELIRKIENKNVFALTSPLITKADGGKFGKTEAGTIWLDAHKTSPYEFYQFWINTSDADVIKFLKFFTFLTQDKIERMAQVVKDNPAERQAQKVLAEEVTRLVHGDQELIKVQRISSVLFSGDVKKLTEKEIEQAFSGVPAFKNEHQEKLLIDLLVEPGIINSKRQAREDVKEGAVYLNGERCTNLEKIIKITDFLYHKYLIIRKGKKNYFLVRW